MPDALRPSASVVRGALPRLWLLALLVLIWEGLARWHDSLFVPPLSRIVLRFFETWITTDPSRLFVSRAFVDHALPSLARFGGGWILAAASGVLLGVMLGRSARLSALTDPIVRFAMAIPPPALLPFAIVLLGIGNEMKVFLVAFGTLWPILLNSIDGARTVDPVFLDTTRALRLSRLRFLTTVLLPAASPQIAAGLRVSLATGLILMVTAELYASQSGIGFSIVNAQRTFRTLDMWATILLLALVGLGVNGAYVWLERRLLHWHHGARRVES